MTKLYVTEFAGLASVSTDGAIDVMPEPATATQVIDTTATTGQIGTLGAITPGSLYTNGSYSNVPLTGGTGSGATANITVAGAAVTVVTQVNRGTGYTAADALSANAASIGGTGSGFSIPVSTITKQITFAATTQYVELAADGICSFKIGTDPVASTTDARLPANNQPIRRGLQLPIGQPITGTTKWKLSAITNT